MKKRVMEGGRDACVHPLGILSRVVIRDPDQNDEAAIDGADGLAVHPDAAPQHPLNDGPHLSLLS
jgi:hypothetical protein